MTVPAQRSVAACLVAMGLFGCGHSENEWQTELQKYNRLLAMHQQTVNESEALKLELAKTIAQVEQLKTDLQKMGLNLETVNEELQQTGTQKEQLTKSVQDMQRALDEYKIRAAQLERIKQRFEEVRDKLKKLTDLGLKVEIRRNRMVIRLPGDVLFASGQDKLRPEGVKVLDAVAEVIRKDPQLAGRYFQVAGHTDTKPLAGGRFEDNWGLSLMRARQVLVYLIGPVDPKKGG
ncbi:MAG TPA: OmpA family protein, partial [Polyangiaceae bacterium]|nr:OmpA family protein [Polyangiaceae bacterium]